MMEGDGKQRRNLVGSDSGFQKSTILFVLQKAPEKIFQFNARKEWGKKQKCAKTSHTSPTKLIPYT